MEKTRHDLNAGKTMTMHYCLDAPHSLSHSIGTDLPPINIRTACWNISTPFQCSNITEGSWRPGTQDVAAVSAASLHHEGPSFDSDPEQGFAYSLCNCMDFLCLWIPLVSQT